MQRRDFLKGAGLAEYDHKNPLALKQPIARGIQLRAFPKDVMDAAQKAAFELYEEESVRNESFRKVYVEWRQYRQTELQWFRLAEASYNNFILFDK